MISRSNEETGEIFGRHQQRGSGGATNAAVPVRVGQLFCRERIGKSELRLALPDHPLIRHLPKTDFAEVLVRFGLGRDAPAFARVNPFIGKPKIVFEDGMAIISPNEEGLSRTGDLAVIENYEPLTGHSKIDAMVLALENRNPVGMFRYRPGALRLNPSVSEINRNCRADNDHRYRGRNPTAPPVCFPQGSVFDKLAQVDADHRTTQRNRRYVPHDHIDVRMDEGMCLCKHAPRQWGWQGRREE